MKVKRNALFILSYNNQYLDLMYPLFLFFKPIDFINGDKEMPGDVFCLCACIHISENHIHIHSWLIFPAVYPLV